MLGTDISSLVSSGVVSVASLPEKSKKIDMTHTETITLGSGCFWCTEAIYQRLEGVVKVTSGYSGGFVDNPTYEQVCDKNTGHAEVCQIAFDTTKISLDDILAQADKIVQSPETSPLAKLKDAIVLVGAGNQAAQARQPIPLAPASPCNTTARAVSPASPTTPGK